MLLVPNATRASFCARKFTSLVDFEHEKMPSASGPCASMLRRNPSAARSSASGQLAVRSTPCSRTSGCVSRSYRRPALRFVAMWTLSTLTFRSEEPDDFAVFVKVDTRGRRHLRQTGHRHDVAAEHDDEFRAGGEPHLSDVDDMARRRAAKLRVRREGVLGFGDADRIVAVSSLLE